MSLLNKLSFETKPVFLIDGTAFVFRAFYAMQHMTRSDGFPTNALFIVLRILMKILREEQPEHIVFIMDGKGPNFRHEAYPEYKANRSETPEQLIQQLAPIRQAITALGVHVEISDGCEADDCIASLASRFGKERPVVILGMDKDLKQCLSENVVIWDPGAKTEKLTTLNDFKEETGLTPAQWPDFQAVIGDSSDNIPGVPGIGPKTAEKIFADYGTLEDIRDNVENLKPAQQKKFADHVDNMFIFRQLTTLSTGVCPHITLDDIAFKPIDADKAASFLREYELRSLLKDLSALVEVPLANGNKISTATENAAHRKALAPNSPVEKATSKTTVGTSDKLQSSSSQGSLFDIAPAGPAAQTVQATTDITTLPDCAGKTIAIIPARAMQQETAPAFTLGIDGEEFALDASGDQLDVLTDKLTACFVSAKLIITPDVKSLIRSHRGWKNIDIARWFDLGLAAYLLNPEERDYTWRKLSRRAEELEVSAGNPALLAHAIAVDLHSKLEQQGLIDLMQSLELPLIPALLIMEERGLRIDATAFDGFLREVQAQLDELTAQIHKIAGGPFNIRSSQQLGELLFGTLGLKPRGKTKGGQMSTSQTVLEKMAGEHEVIDLILEYRKLEKLRSTYLEPLPKLADKESRIHSTFNQLATATGRLSSSTPNLQNIPVRGDFGRRMRSCFNAREGYKLVSADYSQVELRVLAHCSQDPTLLNAFEHDRDIHSSTAAILFDKELDSVEADERRNAKTINFGLVYGMGPQKLAQELKITLKEAKEFIERYFAKLQKLKAFYEQVEEDAKKHGYVTTLTGRRRLVPDIHSQNNQLQSQARRQAINTVIQGSAADIIKIAMIRAATDKKLAELKAELILQVHDELLLEVPEVNAQAAAQHLEKLMRNVTLAGTTLDVPLKVDYGIGDNWGDAH